MHSVFLALILGLIVSDIMIFAVSQRPLKWYEYFLFGSLIKLYIDLHKAIKNDKNS